MSAPFRINWTVRANTRCGHRDYGNGHVCDDCYWDDIQACGDEESEPAPVKPTPKRREAAPCQETLF